MNDRAYTNSQVAHGRDRPIPPVTVLRRKCSCGEPGHNGGSCAACDDEKERTLQRAATSDGGPVSVPGLVHDVLSESGQPLDAPTLASMQPRFKHDFTGVRIHSGGRAAESAKAVDALAYTVGNHVVFGAGRYAPTTGAGRRLLAHELAHVVQQKGERMDGPLVVGPADTFEERAAESAAAEYIQGAHEAGVNGAASRSSPMALPFGVAVPTTIGDKQVWFQLGAGVTRQFPLEPVPGEPSRGQGGAGPVVGAQITGTF